MIVRDRISLGRVWPNASRRLTWLLVFDISIAIAFVYFGAEWLSLPSLPLAMMGGALSIFLAFRNNSAYDRWWEARTLWGGMVNTARTFSRQCLTLIDCEGTPAHDPKIRELVELQYAYVHALRCHLRKQNPFPELGALDPELIERLRAERNVPIALILVLGEKLRELYRAQRLDAFRLTTLDRTLGTLCDVQGGCERIKNTPLPRQYEYLPRVLVSAYCILLPLGQVAGMGLMTPLASVLVAFIFIALEAIGRDLEDPFEMTAHDTPLGSLSRMIEINLRQNLGERELPVEVRPIDGFVY